MRWSLGCFAAGGRGGVEWGVGMPWCKKGSEVW